MAKSSQCTITGQPDFYGLGIRLGLYLQWITQLFVTAFLRSSARFVRAVNLILQLAMFIGLILLTTQHSLSAVEPMILVWLMFGALSSLTRPGISPLYKWSGLVRLTLYAALASYAVWFWFRGIDGMTHGPCGTVAFFGGVDALGPFRLFSQVASTIALALCVAGIATCTIFAWRDSEAPPRSSGRKPVHPVLVALSVAIIGLSVATTEYLIRSNSITDVQNVSGAGQLIPLLVGAYGLAKAVVVVVIRLSRGDSYVDSDSDSE